MSEKPEAWTAADSLIWPHLAAKLIREQHAETERLREEVRNWKKSFVGHVYVKDEDYAELISKRDALKTENERLREALKHMIDVYSGQVQNDGGYTVLDSVRPLIANQAALRREDV